MTLLKADKAAAPRSFFEHWETLRAMTAGRKARSAALLLIVRLNQKRLLRIENIG
jgi:uncharacterized protein (DUF2062 family)